MINEVIVYGLGSQPKGVMNKWVTNTVYPEQGEVLAFMNYIDDNILKVSGLMIPVNTDNEIGVSTDLL